MHRWPFKLVLAALFLGTAAPAMASDFSGLRVFFLGAYLIAAIFAAGIAWFSLKSVRNNDWRIGMRSIVVAFLFAPSFADYPNQFWPTGLVTIFSAMEGLWYGNLIFAFASMTGFSAIIFFILKRRFNARLAAENFELVE